MSTICHCQNPPFHFSNYDTVELGEDSRGAEVELSQCKSCGLMWLEYRIDEPHYSKSGRWWRVSVEQQQINTLSASNAKDFIEEQKECFIGGCFFDSTGQKIFAPISIR